MSGLRFKCGELAIFAFNRFKAGQAYAGQRIEIYAVGPFKAGHKSPWGPRLKHDADYFIIASSGSGGAAKDWQLVKLDDPDASLTRESDVEVEA